MTQRHKPLRVLVGFPNLLARLLAKLGGARDRVQFVITAYEAGPAPTPTGDLTPIAQKATRVKRPNEDENVH